MDNLKKELIYRFINSSDPRCLIFYNKIKDLGIDDEIINFCMGLGRICKDENEFIKEIINRNIYVLSILSFDYDNIGLYMIYKLTSKFNKIYKKN